MLFQTCKSQNSTYFHKDILSDNSIQPPSFLTSQDYEVFGVSSLKEAREFINNESADIIWNTDADAEPAESLWRPDHREV